MWDQCEQKAWVPKPAAMGRTVVAPMPAAAPAAPAAVGDEPADAVLEDLHHQWEECVERKRIGERLVDVEGRPVDVTRTPRR